MGCCGEKRKQKLRRLMQKRLLESDMLKVTKSMKSKIPSSLKTPILLDYHRKTHMLYKGNITRKPPNKDFINSIVNLHNNLVEEMLKRRIKHNTPLSKV
jgi:hypothetical protein